MKRTLIASTRWLAADRRPVAVRRAHARPAKAMTMATRPQRPAPTARSASPTAASSCPSPRSASWACAPLVTEAAELPRTVELGAKVLMDPNAGGKVQPLNAGRIEPGPRGLPNPGRRCARARCWPTSCRRRRPIERSNQAAQLAELRARQVAGRQARRAPAGTGRHGAAQGDRGRRERGRQPGGAHRRRRRRPVHARGAGGAGVGRDRLGQRGGRPGGRCTRTDVRDRRPDAACASRRWPSMPRWLPTSAARRWPSATSVCR